MYDNRKIFSKNLKHYTELTGENQSDIAKVLGVARSSANSYYLGNKMPRMDKVKVLAEHFGCNVSDLIDDTEGTEYVGSAKIPVLGTIPAGVPTEAVEDIIDYEEIPTSLAKTGEFFCLRVKGDSMFPLIYSGETIVIKKQESAENGDVVVALVDNEDTTIKRLKFVEGGLVLEAVNQEYQSLFFSDSQIKADKIKIIGKAVESRKKL